MLLAVTTILESHSVGVLVGSFSKTPRLTSLFKSLRTLSCQCRGIGCILWQATGVALLSTFNLNGGPGSKGRGWHSHVLNTVLLY